MTYSTATNQLLTFGDDPDGTWNCLLEPEAIGILLQAEVANVRYAFAADPEVPAAYGSGFLLVAGAAPIALYGESLLRRLSIIENAAASGATLNYEFLFSDPD